MKALCICVSLVAIFWVFMWWITRPRTVAAVCPDCEGIGYAREDVYFDCPACKGTGLWIFETHIYRDLWIWIR